MRIIETPQDMIVWRDTLDPLTVGFVPTMGALHAGHESLIKKATAENDLSVLSIFVNPTQFNNSDDLAKYPKTWEADLKIAEANKVAAIFAPHPELMYPDQYKYKLTENDFSKGLCGADRPGHFDGVLSVVMKLFNIIQPTRAYFGEKDYQQLTLIRGMVEAFFLPLAIVAVPTMREADGLAMSSRNLRLTPDERKRAPQIYQIIESALNADIAKDRLEQAGFRVDYVTDLNGRRFVAAHLGAVRLIDNVAL